MRAAELHRWDVTPQEAIALQSELVRKLILKSSLTKPPRRIAGADIALDTAANEGCAGVIVYSYPDLEPLEYVSARRKLAFPYIPGLLTFREGPILLEAFAKVTQEPDVLIFDGQGIAHPRGMGIAAHMGLLLDKPSIGCGKSKLCGEYEEPEPEPGRWSPLTLWERQIGVALRTRRDSEPVFISPGHRMDFDAALEIVLKCLDGYRIPKPTREADAFVAAAKKGLPYPPKGKPKATQKKLFN